MDDQMSRDDWANMFSLIANAIDQNTEAIKDNTDAIRKQTKSRFAKP